MDVVGQGMELATEHVEELSEFMITVILTYVISGVLVTKLLSLLEGTKTISISRMTQTTFAALFLILILPILSIGHTILLYILLIISPTIKNSKQLIGLSKLRKDRWKPEYLDLYESQKLHDWDIKVTPDSIFSKVKQSQEGR
ncbi:hypothetical protein MGH68_18640 [Erysipelothrix sp. D19-032]